MATESLGEQAVIQIEGVTLCTRTGELNNDTAEVGTTCTHRPSGRFGFNTRTRGPRNCVASHDSQWRPEDNPFGNAPALETGEDALTTLVYPDIVDGPTHLWHFPTIFISNITVRFDAESVQSISIQWKNQGPFYTPSRLFTGV